MKEQNIAKVYAQSFLALGNEGKFDIAEELTTLTEAINVCNDLENVLFLEVFTDEEKKGVIEAISKKLKLNNTLTQAINFLIDEKRIGILPLIFKEVIVYDDHQKGFLRGTIEGYTENIPSDVQTKIENYIEQRLGKKPVLNYEQSEKVTAGYRVTVEDLQLDASVDSQLDQLKESILGQA